MQPHQQPQPPRRSHDHRVVSTSPPASAVQALLNNQVSPPLVPAATPPALSRPRSGSNAGSGAAPVRRMVSDYVIDVRIGSGSFATVWRGYHKTSHQLVAIKSVSKDRIQVNKKHQENLDLEIAIMQHITHANIVKLYQVIDSPRHKYLILEYCAGGDLSKYIKKHGPVTEQVAKHFFGQLASGLEFLRKANLIHRDLKPQNLLLDSSSPVSSPLDLTLKVADFGFARYMESDNLAQTICGSPLYMAPEILESGAYDASVDLWSAGGILYEMLYGKPPFIGNNHYQLLERIKTSEVRFPLPSVGAPDISDECKHLMLGLLRREPRERMPFDAFFAHPWVRDAMEQVRERQSAATLAANATAVSVAQQRNAQVQQQQAHQQAPPSQQMSPSPSLNALAASLRADHNPRQPLSAQQQAATPTSAAGALSSTPPNPPTPATPSSVFHQRNPSNLYGSSPSQNSFLPNNNQQQQPPHSLPSQQYVGSHHNSPGLGSGLPSAGHSPSSFPTQYHNAAGQTYHRPLQQQVGFHPQPQQHQPSSSLSPPSPHLTSVAHQQQAPRPISRHNTPQNLQSLRGSGDAPGGSASSIDREYVLIDEATAGSHSQHSSREHLSPPQQQPPPIDYEAERTRLQIATKNAKIVAKMADAKLAALYSFGELDVGAHEILTSMLRELEIKEDPTAANAVSQSVMGHSTLPATPLEHLAAVLNLYLKSLSQLDSLASDLPRIRSSLGIDSDRLADFQSIDEYIRSTMADQWKKCQCVRRAIEELEASAQQATANTVRLIPPSTSPSGAVAVNNASTTPVALSSSRRNSMTPSTSMSQLTTVGSLDDKSPLLHAQSAPSSAIASSSRLGSVLVVCAEAALYNDALAWTRAGMDEEYVGHYEQARALYQQAAKVLEALALDERATQADRTHLAEVAQNIRRQIDAVAAKHPNANAAKSQQQAVEVS